MASNVVSDNFETSSGGVPQLGGTGATTCKAWVNFNGTGTVAIRDSYNVSSVVDYGAGSYGINLSNAMPNANYSPVGSSGSPSSESYRSRQLTITSIQVGWIGVNTIYDIDTRLDSQLISLQVFGD